MSNGMDMVVIYQFDSSFKYFTEDTILFLPVRYIHWNGLHHHRGLTLCGFKVLTAVNGLGGQSFD